MSRKVDINNLDEKQIDKITKDLYIEKEPSKYAYGANSTFLELYSVSGNDLYVPFAYENFIRPELDSFSKRKVEFTGCLRPEQRVVKSEAISHLNETGSCLISSYCGFGKTCLAIYISSKIGVKTLIITHLIVLINQWKEAINRFCPNAKIQVLNSSNKLEEADFYIINATNINKLIEKHGLYFFKDIGFLIVDEAHIIMAEKMSSCMKYITPRYVLGLSATPYRTDGLNILLDMYFGKNKIIRKLWRTHTVYEVKTGMKPEVKLNKIGKVDWNSVLDSQCLNEKRNRLIVDIIKRFPDRFFLVLCKRIEQANYIYDLLKEEKEDVTSLIGKQQEYEQSSRILIATCKKCGVGFDHPKLNTLILASDVEQYFIQYLGRVFRTENTEPIIFDLVDDYILLHRHFKTRAKIYLEHGGTIKNFSL